MKEVPIWEKSNLTLEEAAAYSGIGINKLREISNDERCPFVLWVGSKRLIKRKDFDRYIEQTYSLSYASTKTSRKKITSGWHIHILFYAVNAGRMLCSTPVFSSCCFAHVTRVTSSTNARAFLSAA